MLTCARDLSTSVVNVRTNEDMDVVVPRYWPCTYASCKRAFIFVIMGNKQDLREARRSVAQEAIFATKARKS